MKLLSTGCQGAGDMPKKCYKSLQLHPAAEIEAASGSSSLTSSSWLAKAHSARDEHARRARSAGASSCMMFSSACGAAAQQGQLTVMAKTTKSHQCMQSAAQQAGHESSGGRPPPTTQPAGNAALLLQASALQSCDANSAAHLVRQAGERAEASRAHGCRHIGPALKQPHLRLHPQRVLHGCRCCCCR